MDLHEQIHKQEVKSGKLNDTLCPECGMFLCPVKRPGGIYWTCSTIDECNYNRFEENED